MDNRDDITSPDFAALAKRVVDRDDLVWMLQEVYSLGWAHGNHYGWCDEMDKYYGGLHGGLSGNKEKESKD